MFNVDDLPFLANNKLDLVKSFGELNIGQEYLYVEMYKDTAYKIWYNKKFRELKETHPEFTDTYIDAIVRDTWSDLDSYPKQVAIESIEQNEVTKNMLCRKKLRYKGMINERGRDMGSFDVLEDSSCTEDYSKDRPKGSVYNIDMKWFFSKNNKRMRLYHSPMSTIIAGRELPYGVEQHVKSYLVDRPSLLPPPKKEMSKGGTRRRRKNRKLKDKSKRHKKQKYRTRRYK